MKCVRRHGAILLFACLAIAPQMPVAAQPDPTLFGTPNTSRSIPAPPPVTIRPREFAAYGALITAAMLTTLYVYRGRAFIVYWIGSWLLFAASLALLGRGYGDVRLGSVMLGLAQLLGVWSAGLMLLAAGAFPDAPLRWNTPLRVAVLTGLWFLATPFVLPLVVVLSTGPAATAALLAWAAIRYLRLAVRTRYVGVAAIGTGLLLLSATYGSTAAVALNLLWDVQVFNDLLGFNIVVSMFVALAMHVLVFEDMTAELRNMNRELAHTHMEVKRLVITDPLTGCHNRRFFDEIQRREVQRHRRYEAPLSVVFVDVNRFKRLNDTLGHDVGDEVLKTIGALLRHNVRESDYVIRWGGDEFLLLLTCGLSEAEHKAAELKKAFERERQDTQLPEGIGLSIGVAPVAPDADDLAAAIRLADSRMYHDKLGDRGR